MEKITRIKRKTNVFILIVLMSILVIFTLTGCQKKVKVDKFNEINVFSGSTLYGGVNYKLEDTKLIKTVKKSFLDNEPDVVETIELNSEQIEKVKNIMKKYQDNINSWEKSYVKDEIDGGKNFNFSIKDKNGKSIKVECTDDSDLPKDIANFKEEILNIFDEFSVSNNNSNSSSSSRILSPNNENKNEAALYTYSSGDNAAENGNGELLYVYEMNDNIIRFKYHSPWNESDVSGTATKASEDLYVYQKDNYKIEILLNSMGENSVKVSEYDNDSIQSWKNLWR